MSHTSKELRLVKRMWVAGTPAKEIAQITGIPWGTIRSWRNRLDWPKRGRRRVDFDSLVFTPEPVVATWWRCPHCPGRSDSPTGHTRCQEVA